MSSQQPGPWGPQQPAGGAGPYGQPPQPGAAPNPYAPQGGPGVAPQPGYGYPAQGGPGVPPQQGYGYPAAPGRSAPYGGQPGGPAPGMPPQAPQGGSKTGRTVGIALGAVVVVGAVIGGVLLLGGDPSYKLTTPQTVAGEYERQGESKSETAGAFAKDKAPGMTATGGVNATYKSGATKTLSFGGNYGEVDDPEASVDWALEQSGKSTGGKAVGEPETFTPAGFDGDVMKCQQLKVVTMHMGMCTWADSSTLGLVGQIDTSGGLSSEPVDLEETAEITAKVREDAMTEAG